MHDVLDKKLAQNIALTLDKLGQRTLPLGLILYLAEQLVVVGAHLSQGDGQLPTQPLEMMI